MATTANELVIKITGDVSGFKGSLAEASSSNDSFATSLNQAAELAKKAYELVKRAVEYTIGAYAESQEATNRLTLALQNQGIYSDKLSNSYKDQAEELQRLTGIDNDSITKGQAQLQMMIGRTKITKEMSAAAVDLGAAMGGDVSQGFEVLGRSIDGQTRGLKALGIEIDQNLTQEERTQQILRKVSVAYGGLAESQNQGLGSIKGLKSAINDVMKDIGESLAPTVTKATKLMTEFFESMHEKHEAKKSPFATVDSEISALQDKIASLQFQMRQEFNPEAVKAIEKEIERLNGQMDTLGMKRIKMDAHQATSGDGGVQSNVKREEAIKIEKEKRAQESRERNALVEHNAYIKTAIESHSKDVLDLAKQEDELTTAIADEKNKRIRGDLEMHLSLVKKMREDANINEVEQQQTFNQEYDDLVKEHGALMEGQRLEFEEKEKQALMSERMTESQAKKQYFVNEIKEENKRHNQLLMDQQKYGMAYAQINRVMHSEIYQGSKQAFGELAQLTQSSNSTLKGIGKVAAIASIIIKTAESAMNIYAGFSAIPIIGPALGIAGAAAAIAFGGEQIQHVTSAAQGGLITGGIPGIDSVPVLAQRNELIAPAQNFEEVVGSVAARRLAEEQGGSAFGGHQMVTVAIQMDGREAERVLTARTTEARRLGIYSGV